MTTDIRSRIIQFTAQPVRHETAELGTVFVRRLTLGELDKMQTEQNAPAKDGAVPVPLTVRLLSRFIGDESGAPVFDLATPGDRDALMAMPVGIAAEILRWGQQVNKLEETKGDAKNA